MVNLQDLVKETGDPGRRWFSLVDGLAGLDILPDDDEETTPDLRLEVKYLSQRDIRKLATEGITRKALTRGGGRALAVNEEKNDERLVLAALTDWDLTVHSAQLLEAEINFGDMLPKMKIEFTEQNIKALVHHSNLPGVVRMILAEHDEWFAMERNADLGNSGSGPSSSSVTPPVESASTDT
jgi:hypothetical protein